MEDVMAAISCPDVCPFVRGGFPEREQRFSNLCAHFGWLFLAYKLWRALQRAYSVLKTMWILLSSPLCFGYMSL